MASLAVVPGRCARSWPCSRAHLPSRRRRASGGEAGRSAERSMGTSSSPTYVASAPGTGGFLYVVEQGGTIRLVNHGKRRGSRSWTSQTRSPPSGEQGLLSMAFDPDYASNHLFYIYLHERQTAALEIARVPCGLEHPGEQASRRRVIVVTASPSEATTTAASSSSVPTATSTSATGDGGERGRPSTTRAEPRTPDRQAPADRSPTSMEARRTRFPGTTRTSASRAATRSTPTACATPTASPSTQRPGDSRSATSGRAPGRRSTTWPAVAPRGELRLAHLEGRAVPTQPPGSATRTTGRRSSRSRSRATAATALRDHRRLRRPRPAA